MSFAGDLLKKVASDAARLEGIATQKPKRVKKVRVVRNRRGPVKTWSDEDNEKLARLAEKLEGPEIADRMGRTYQSIRNQAHRLGIKLIAKRCNYASWTKAAFCKIEAMYNAGYTSVQIAENLHLSDNQVRGAIGRMGLAGSRNHKWKFIEEWALANYFEKKTASLLADIIGVSEAKCQSRINKLTNTRQLRNLREIEPSTDIVAKYCKENKIEIPKRKGN